MVKNKTSSKEKSELEKCWEAFFEKFKIYFIMKKAAEKWGLMR